MADVAVAEPPQQTQSAPANSGKDFIKEAMAHAFGADAVKPEKQKPQVEPKSKEPKAKAQIPDAQAREEQQVEAQTPEVVSDDVPETPEAAETPEQKETRRWKELKGENKTLAQRLKEYEAKEKEFSTSSEELKRLQTEAQTYKQQLEEAHKELYVSRVEATPEWKKGVLQPMDDIIDQVKIIATSNKVDPNKLMDALDRASKGDRTLLKEVSETLDEYERGDLHSLTKNLIQVDKRIQELKSNSKEAYETSLRNQQQEQELSKSETIKQYQKAADTISEKFVATVESLLPEDHDINFDMLKVDSQTIDSWRTDEKVYAAYAGAALPELIKQMKAQSAELTQAKEQLAKFRNGSAPSKGTAPNSPKEAKKPETTAELGKKSYQQYGQEASARFNSLFRT